MMKGARIVLFLLVISACSFLYKLSIRGDCLLCMPTLFQKNPEAEDVLKNGTRIIPSNGTSPILRKGSDIFFLETSDGREPRTLVSCAVESAARMYPDRSIVFLMKGLVNHKVEETSTTHTTFNLLSSIDNVFIQPLDMEQLFQDTPLLSWYQKVNPALEKYWLHVSADAARLAVIWKYGGMYTDSDIISIRPIPVENFLATEEPTIFNNGMLGFSTHHEFTWECMEDFVKSYRGDIWGHQGPRLVTRMLERYCKIPSFNVLEDGICRNISFLNPQRFYPIPCGSWSRYFDVWGVNPTFNDSYGLHLWNYMNREGKKMVPGSKTLMEHLYKTFCPSTYEFLSQQGK